VPVPDPVSDPKPPELAAEVRGRVTVEIDPQGLEATIRFQPDPRGRAWTREALLAALEKKGVKEQVDGQALEELLRTGQGAQIQGDPGAQTVVVARGRPPEPGEPARLKPGALELPAAVAGSANQLAGPQLPPRVFRREVEKVAVEKTVTVKPRFPFLKARKERKTTWQRREHRIGVEVSPGGRGPESRGVGYARAGEVVATVSPSRRGRPGRSVLGQEIPPPPPAGNDVLLGEHLNEHGTEIRAAAAGFVRWGADWIELVPFEAHEFKVSAEAQECLLDFLPGSEAARPPTADEVRAAALRLGFGEEELLSEEEVALLLSRSLTDKAPLVRSSLCRARDAEIRIDIGEDRLRASLTLVKGRGTGRKLALAEVGEEIRRQKLKGMDTERVRRDILEFARSEKSSLESYVLVEGRAPEPGAEGTLEWRVNFLPESKAKSIREQSLGNVDRLQGPAAVASLSEFPLEAVEQIAEVEQDRVVARLHAAGAGLPGVDVFGTGLPGPKGREPVVQTFENLQNTRGELVSRAAGLLERGSRGETLLLRVRPHRDGEARVRISEDRLQAFLSLLPSQGTGRPLSAQLVDAALLGAGVTQGISRETLAEATARAQDGEAVEELLVAEGQPAEAGRDTELQILVRQASGQAVSVAGDGRADYKRQDKITTVAAGTLLARLPAPTPGGDGWDVTGKKIPARKGAARYVHAGKNVESRQEPEGGTGYYAGIDGELHCDDSSLDVLRVHTVSGDVGLSTGNVKFPGTIRIEGSVRGGFTVMGEESVFVEGTVQGALVSAGESIQIGKGIVGEGKAVLRARKMIRAHFAEQATLLAVEDIRLGNACLRCRVKCNGKVVLESDKGNLVGGSLQAKLGLQAANIGSEREVPTEIAFGQDVLVGDQLEREERQAARLKARNREIDAAVRRLERESAAAANELGRLRAEKLSNLKNIELHAKRIFILQERFEQHFPSEVVVRGVVHPGVVLRSHGRSRQIKVALREVVFYFDTSKGRIDERALTG
jgi:uncharacterized protein (DUF342 family)